MSHEFCRKLLAETMRQVREVTTADQRSHAWAWGQGEGSTHEFHGPEGYEWHGQAHCKWDARCKGWEAYLKRYINESLTGSR